MKKSVAIFAFNGEAMCFAHALLNARDMAGRGWDVKLVIEGSATKLVSTLADPQMPFADLFAKVKADGLVDCVCEACARKMGSLDDARQQDLALCSELMGHPSMGRYMEAGYEIVVF